MNNKNRFKNIGNAILIFFLFRYSAFFQLIPVLLFKLDLENISDKTGVLLSGFGSLVLAIILFFIFRKDLIKEFKIFKNNFWKNFDVGIKYWGIGLFLMILFNTIIMRGFGADQAGNEESVQNMISTLPYLMLINAGIIAPFCEEIVFRKNIKNIFNNKWFYMVVSGILFGLGHVLGKTNSLIDWFYILPYGSLGAAFAISYYDTDTIFTPIMFHVIHNMMLVVLAII